MQVYHSTENYSTTLVNAVQQKLKTEWVRSHPIISCWPEKLPNMLQSMLNNVGRNYPTGTTHHLPVPGITAEWVEQCFGRIWWCSIFRKVHPTSRRLAIWLLCNRSNWMWNDTYLSQWSFSQHASPSKAQPVN